MRRSVFGTEEAIEPLKGEGPEDLQDLVMKLGMEIVRLAGVAGSTLSAKQTVKKAIDEGTALQKLKDMLSTREAILNTLMIPKNYR